MGASPTRQPLQPEAIGPAGLAIEALRAELLAAKATAKVAQVARDLAV